MTTILIIITTLAVLTVIGAWVPSLTSSPRHRLFIQTMSLTLRQRRVGNNTVKLTSEAMG